jgi:WASH complex subunit 7
LIAAVRDPVKLLHQALHDEPTKLVGMYRGEIMEMLTEEIIDPLCREIDLDLRSHIHSAHDIKLDQENPFKAGLRDLGNFCKLRPLRFFDEVVDIKVCIEHYLDRNFYDLTTGALHTWQTYGEMRNLAEERYGLVFTETHLPGQTLEQGLDVLEIMRNIHIFVAHYNYNLNTQVFIERPRDQKFLNTISIRHIANSIRTHGTGIMNTTVNFTYQFLAQKFQIFSQFLYDDHIKSRLIKDIRYFKEKREELDNQYPYDRAEKFNRDIKKLGMTPEGLSYLDQFRMLITEVGNALGYVRMVRAGGLNYCSNAIKYVPDLNNILEFKELSAADGLDEETVTAAENLDQVLTNLSRSFAEGTDFFKKLVDVFKTELSSEQNMHLRNFHIIVPPLCVNYIEHMMASRDRLNKGKHAKDGCFTDDGFAIGVAYILKTLQLNSAYDSLHWYESTQKVFNEMMQKVAAEQQQQRRTKDSREDKGQAEQLAMDRQKQKKEEMDMLHFSLSGARIFFRD